MSERERETLYGVAIVVLVVAALAVAFPVITGANVPKRHLIIACAVVTVALAGAAWWMTTSPKHGLRGLASKRALALIVAFQGIGALAGAEGWLITYRERNLAGILPPRGAVDTIAFPGWDMLTGAHHGWIVHWQDPSYMGAGTPPPPVVREITVSGPAAPPMPVVVVFGAAAGAIVAMFVGGIPAAPRHRPPTP